MKKTNIAMRNPKLKSKKMFTNHIEATQYFSDKKTCIDYLTTNPLAQLGLAGKDQITNAGNPEHSDEIVPVGGIEIEKHKDHRKLDHFN